MGDGQQVGTVAEVWRFPVKSLQGEALPALDLTAGGFVGDRAWGIVDAATGRTLSAKTVPELLFASARLDGDTVVVALPDGAEHDAADPATSAAIAAWLDRDCALRRAG